MLRNFNSIKVRLERKPNLANSSRILFQFHKGTIRTPPLLVFINCLINFNSIKVRLEPFASVIVPFALPFQFHKGTIRTGDDGLGVPYK